MNSEFHIVLKHEAQRLGFSACGISKALEVGQQFEFYKQWLKNNFHGKMAYLENHLEKKADPRLLFDGAKSIVSVLINYYNEDEKLQNTSYKISKYAWGNDYHYVVKQKLRLLLEFILQQFPETRAGIYVDTAPVLEKYWAQQAGLGWIGKNTCLLNRTGSYFFIGELILDLELKPDTPMKDYCGNCTQCIDACPVGALESPYILNAKKCIAYQTVENKDEIPEQFIGQSKGYVYGCDICQEVCPWNKKVVLTEIGDFKTINPLLNMDLKKVTKTKFRKATKNSAMQRIKFEKFKSNLSLVNPNDTNENKL